MNEVIIIGVVSLGTLFILLAAIGLVRMPDLYLRISVTTKAATLGVGLLLLGTALYFKEISITTRAIAIIFFLILTAPIGAHLIGRASYFIGIPLWKKSVIDDLKDKYDHKTHGLEGKKNENEDTPLDSKETN
jgi:multicomponent Na+:H+ antiporter subunit G